MSYWVYVTSKCEHCGGGAEYFERNLAYNVLKFWHLGNSEITFRDLDQMKGEEASAQIRKVIRYLNETDNETLNSLNPDNGWGTWSGLLGFLRDMEVACRENPHSVVTIS